MKTAERYAIDQMIEASRSLVGDQKIAIVLRAYAGTPEYSEVLQLIADKQLSWLDWLTTTQRRWQRQTRRPSRARHHDSIAIREAYVRCHQ